jgi:hypothetical protein
MMLIHQLFHPIVLLTLLYVELSMATETCHFETLRWRGRILFRTLSCIICTVTCMGNHTILRSTESISWTLENNIK